MCGAGVAVLQVQGRQWGGAQRGLGAGSGRREEPPRRTRPRAQFWGWAVLGHPLGAAPGAPAWWPRTQDSLDFLALGSGERATGTQGGQQAGVLAFPRPAGTSPRWAPRALVSPGAEGGGSGASTHPGSQAQRGTGPPKSWPGRPGPCCPPPPVPAVMRPALAPSPISGSTLLPPLPRDRALRGLL